MKKILSIAAIIFFILFTSCNRNAEKAAFSAPDVELIEPDQASLNGTSDQQQIPVGKPPSLLADTSSSPTQSPAVSTVDWDKKIIKTATLRLEITDFKKYNDYVHNAVKAHGAYISGEEQNLQNDRSETNVTIKVPVAQFEAMMNSLPGADSKVLERKITTEDVTGEVVDTKSRLESKKQMRLKYLEFLKQSKNMAEVLEVQSEINNIQEQIESAASRIGFLSHQAAYSTINLSFFQPMAGYISGNDSPSFLSKLSNAFKNGLSWFGELFLALVSIWPLFVILLVFYVGWKLIRKQKMISVKS
ncbi:MAG: DUF4349 domain-containing protein [Chitinophagaceae bacterium]|nr:DUF4349 domain-containing protein [Chitinophagaceae bacterium]